MQSDIIRYQYQMGTALVAVFYHRQLLGCNDPAGQTADSILMFLDASRSQLDTQVPTPLMH